MPIAPELLELMPRSVVWQQREGSDQYGHPLYGPRQTIQHCRIQYRPLEVVSPEGQETLRAATIFIGSPVSIALSDRIELPDGSSPRIVDVAVVDDETGPHHTVVQLAVSRQVP